MFGIIILFNILYTLYIISIEEGNEFAFFGDHFKSQNIQYTKIVSSIFHN